MYHPISWAALFFVMGTVFTLDKVTVNFEKIFKEKKEQKEVLVQEEEREYYTQMQAVLPEEKELPYTGYAYSEEQHQAPQLVELLAKASIMRLQKAGASPKR